MPTDRPNLILDEQSFQGLLSAAFTIQEHNDRQRRSRQTEAEPEIVPVEEPRPNCPRCGATKAAEESRCENCDGDALRPGEKLQRNWASMWLMSQEQGLWPARSSRADEATHEADTATHETVAPLPARRDSQPRAARELTASNFLAVPARRRSTTEADSAEEVAAVQDRLPRQPASAKTIGGSNLTAEIGKPYEPYEIEPKAEAQVASVEHSREELAADKSPATADPFRFSARSDSGNGAMMIDAEASDESSNRVNLNTLNLTDAALAEAGTASPADEAAPSFRERLAAWSVTLHFRRADLYLGAAIFIAVMAVMWPAAGSSRRPTLSAWDRTLITLGIAEAPAATPVHLPGDASISVWVDPHTALYYCPGDEQYGKTRDGRVSSQRDAQTEGFEPASRTACE